jgi:hypothetical protein
MAKLLTTLQHSDQLINRIQDGIVQVVNPLLKAWYDKFGIPGDCSGTLITQRVTLADDWIAPTLLNSWVDYGGGSQTARYRKLNGLVYVEGRIKNGTAVDVCTLPVGYRPAAILAFATNTGTGAGAFAKLDVLADGTINAQGANLAHSINCVFAPVDPSPVPNPIFPLTLAHGLTPGKHPTTVLLADAVDVTSLAHVSSSCSWKPYDDTRVQIVDLPGLYATRTYDLTFLVLGG